MIAGRPGGSAIAQLVSISPGVIGSFPRTVHGWGWDGEGRGIEKGKGKYRREMEEDEHDIKSVLA